MSTEWDTVIYHKGFSFNLLMEPFELEVRYFLKQNPDPERSWGGTIRSQPNRRSDGGALQEACGAVSGGDVTGRIRTESSEGLGTPSLHGTGSARCGSVTGAVTQGSSAPAGTTLEVSFQELYTPGPGSLPIGLILPQRRKLR